MVVLSVLLLLLLKLVLLLLSVLQLFVLLDRQSTLLIFNFLTARVMLLRIILPLLHVILHVLILQL